MKKRYLIGSSSHHSEEHQEPWLISYADMMTVLFGFFVILYSMSQLDPEKLSIFGKQMAKDMGGKTTEAKSESVVGSISESRKIRALHLLVAILNLGDDVDSLVAKIEKAAQKDKTGKAAMAALKKSLAEATGKDGLTGFSETEATEKTVRIAMPGDLIFRPGTDRLTPQAEAAVGRLAREIQGYGDYVAVEVEGHTDSRAPNGGGGFRSNFALSTARAASVAEVLTKNGTRADAVRVVGLGATKPLFPEFDANKRPIERNMEKNRRVEIVVRKAATR